MVRLPEDDRGCTPSNLLIETPGGHAPSLLASIEDGEGPNQVSRENARRRIVISANTDGSDMARSSLATSAARCRHALPEGISRRWKASSRRRSRRRN